MFSKKKLRIAKTDVAECSHEKGLDDDAAAGAAGAAEGDGDAAAAAGVGDSDADSDAAGDESAYTAIIEEKDAEIADFKDKYMRGLADIENLRRRQVVELEKAKDFGIQKFSKDLITVADVLELAIENAPPGVAGSDEVPVDPQLKSLFEGMDGTRKMLLKVFGTNGLQASRPLDEVFDPNTMEAQFQVPDPSKEACVHNCQRNVATCREYGREEAPSSGFFLPDRFPFLPSLLKAPVHDAHIVTGRLWFQCVYLYLLTFAAPSLLTLSWAMLTTPLYRTLSLNRQTPWQLLRVQDTS